MSKFRDRWFHFFQKSNDQPPVATDRFSFFSSSFVRTSKIVRSLRTRGILIPDWIPRWNESANNRESDRRFQCPRYGYVSKANANGGSRYPELSNHARLLYVQLRQFWQRTFFCVEKNHIDLLKEKLSRVCPFKSQEITVDNFRSSINFGN